MVPLHVKSAYSLGVGTTPVEKLVERASALGIRAMALTDIDNLYGALVFYRLARARGIRPILGVELPLGSSRCSPERLVLLAQNRTGYQNLCKIITRRKLEEGFDPLGNLPRFAEGLFILTDRPETMARLLALSASRVRAGGDKGAGIDRRALRFLLVRPPPATPGGPGGTFPPHSPRGDGERRLLDAAAAWNIPLVADADIAFLDPTDHAFHRVLAAIRENALVSQIEEPAALGPARYFPGPREWAARFDDVPEAVREAERIADLCDLDLGPSRPIFPRIFPPHSPRGDDRIFPPHSPRGDGGTFPPHSPRGDGQGETAFSALVHRCFKGLEVRYRQITPAILDRLNRELELIEKLGFCEYFLVVGDIVERATRRGIEVVGRGSGASSIVTYLLGLTNVDPLAHGLRFERFLHPQRPDLPDIDIDLCWIRRDEVIEDVYRTYGKDRVAMISSHITFQQRSAFREAAKAFGVPPDEINHKEIPREEEPYRSALPFAERLVGLPHHLSIHPGGIVIGDRPLDFYVPLERAAKGIVVTQYDMYSIEDVGLVKIDLLGNRCLTEIQETMELARCRLSDIPDGDPKTAALLREGNTIGCFQIESPAMRALLRQLQVESVRDCIVAVALIRPGPSEGGMKERYLRRATGEERVEYLCPQLREVLGESYGIMLYEEDVMRVAHAVAGISLADGDLLRSKLKKCTSEEELRELENDFLRRAIASGVAPDAALAVWKDLIRFSRYTFNKAHAAGYGLLAYQSAYMKAHHPVEFACALLNNHAGMYSPRTISEEVRRMGVRLLPPCANHSGRRHQVEEVEPSGRAARLALDQVKGLSQEAIESILCARPFRSLGDLLRRTRIPQRELEALILAGALDFTGLNHPQLLWELETTYQRECGRGDLGLAAVGGDDWSYPQHPLLRDYSPIIKVRNEMQYLEMALTAHPLALLRESLAKRGCLTIREALEHPGRGIQVAGLLAATRRAPTKSGGTMGFLTLEDETGLLETTLFPKVFRQFGKRITSLGPYLAEGSLEERWRAFSMNIRTLERLENLG